MPTSLLNFSLAINYLFPARPMDTYDRHAPALPTMPSSPTPKPAAPPPVASARAPITKPPVKSPPPSNISIHSTQSASKPPSSPSSPSSNPRKRRLHLTHPPAKRPHSNRPGALAPTGNYRNYYRRRLGRGTASTDARLSLLLPTWVSPSGRVLDIGCNDGLFTLEVARRFPFAHITGLDADATLVARASQRVRTLLASAPSPTNDFPANASFVTGDIAAHPAPPVLAAGPYDLVLALSVSKWIHLHGGDEGLRLFFARVLAALAPGGVFVLEPQPSRSYKKARRRGAVPSDRTMNTFKLRPEQFADFLVSEKGGFDRVVTLREVQGKNIPFGNRPVFAFFKPMHDAAAGDCSVSSTAVDNEKVVDKAKTAVEGA